MATTVFVFIVLFVLFLIIMIFSFNLNIIISFYISADFTYRYSVSINKIYRADNFKKRKRKRKNKNAAKNILTCIKIFKHHIDVHHLSIIGNISFCDAASTALLSGITYIVSGFFISYISHFCNSVSISQIQINPQYNNKIEGDLFFECIAEANVGNIIIESLKNFKGIKKILSTER